MTAPSAAVRTRFAPSPTGYLHIGGVRTALYNWLFARRNGGSFILRIDDTDRSRNLEEALQPILHGFRWLGIDWDEGPGVEGACGPYFQSQREDHYREAVALLVERGLAYRDYATPEEIAAEREAAQRHQRRFLYSRRWMAETEADCRRFEAEGRRAAVRLKMPREGVCRFADRIRGEVEFEWAREQDHVVQRADGSFLYHLASAVDDHAMGITHVIRAEEHLSNTPRQIFIARGLGYELPEYAHLPVVAAPGSRRKLSKRKLAAYLKQPDFAALAERGAAIAKRLALEVDPESFNPVLVGFYEAVGFLPEALLNYLLLLGWSLDDRSEDFSREAMVRHFSLERVGTAPASFDPAKLMAFEERWAQRLDPEARLAWTLPFLERAGWIATPPSEAERSRVAAILAAAGDRIKVAGDVLDYGEFFVADDRLAYDEKAFAKRLATPPQARKHLAGFRQRLADAGSWDAASLEALMRDFVAERQIRLGDVIHAVRVAVTGKAVGFGLFEILVILGRDSVLARIDRALARLD